MSDFKIHVAWGTTIYPVNKVAAKIDLYDNDPRWVKVFIIIKYWILGYRAGMDRTFFNGQAKKATDNYLHKRNVVW